MVHQHFRLVEAFTVAENVVLGDHRGEARRFRLRPRAIERRVAELGEEYGLAVEPRAKIWQLSLGEQQRVEILKALYRESRVLILDEPTAVLTPQEAESLFETVRAMASEGRTIIFISHKLHEVKAVADRVTVLRAGRSIGTVSAADSTPQSLTALMVGRDLGGGTATESKPRDEVVLEVDDLWAEGDRGEEAVKGVSFSVRAGEILAVAGVAGNGQRELAETITGMRPALRGGLRLGGAKLAAVIRARQSGRGSRTSRRTGSERGLRRASPSPPTSCSSPTAVAPIPAGRSCAAASIRRKADELIRSYDVRGSATTVARQLSGGNLQKVVLGREFAGDPKVLVAASPTRGLDVAAIETVHGHLRDAAGAGMAILLISEDLDEILALADRIVVMYEGAIVGEVDPKAATVNEIGLLMAGGGRA